MPRLKKKRIWRSLEKRVMGGMEVIERRVSQSGHQGRYDWKGNGAARNEKTEIISK